MKISSIAITTFLAVVANVRGDGSAALQPDPTGIEDKQHDPLAQARLFVLPDLPGAFAHRGAAKPKPSAAAERGEFKHGVAARGLYGVGNDPIRSAPWNDLKGEIGSSTRLIDTTNAVYRGQCYPEYRDKSREYFELGTNGPTGYELPHLPDERTNWNLVSQPDGICMATFNCGYKQCSPFSIGEGKSLLEIFARFNETEILDGDPANPVLEPTNPAFNLPPKVIFPKTAADVVKTVRFAKKHSLELSVKNSGHHYAGASTKAGTLLVNMFEFQKYSEVQSCDEVQDIDLTDLSNQPCQVALARNKIGYVRVGGGESWSDAYTAVRNENLRLNETSGDGFMYHVVGGAAGSVSPQGWTWQGCLSGTNAQGLFGLGLDQVLMIEAVLPNGEHVRFGPTEWEDAPGFDVPKTTKVEGRCNAKASQGEEDWQGCESDIDFDGLWFAFRGAGFGTYGICTSVYLQLHPYRAYTQIYWKYDLWDKGRDKKQCPDIPEPSDPATGVRNPDLSNVFYNFTVDFLLDPESLNIPEDIISNATLIDISTGCGTYILGTQLLFCYAQEGKDASQAKDVFFDAWEYYINETSLDFGDSRAAVRSCPRTYQQFFESEYGTFDDYASSIVFQEGPYAGIKAMDAPIPNVCPTEANCNLFLQGQLVNNILIPTDWALNNKAIVSFLFTFGTGYTSWGNQGKSWKASDQTSSVSKTYREAAFMFFNPINANSYQFVVDMYNISGKGDGDDFPAYLGGNHYSPYAKGPLKSDWTKVCPTDYSVSKRDRECVSLQDAVWGTKNLRRLERIKMEVDPGFMFDCDTCVLNNRKRNKGNSIGCGGMGNKKACDKVNGCTWNKDEGSCDGSSTSIQFQANVISFEEVAAEDLPNTSQVTGVSVWAIVSAMMMLWFHL